MRSKFPRSFRASTGEPIEQMLLRLGVISPQGDLSQPARSALAYPEEAVTLFRRHRVVGLAMRRLLEIEPYDSLPAELRNLIAWRRTLDNLLEAGWEELKLAVRETGVSASGIKGMVMRSEYVEPSDRDSGDIDLVVASIDEAWKLAMWFRGRGYDWCEYEWPWMKRDLTTQAIYGQFQVWKPCGEHYLRFDIHFGGYSVRHCRLAPCVPSSSGLAMISPSANLACLLGNASGDFLIRLKDVNDVATLLRNGRLSVKPTTDTVKMLNLDRFWNTLVGHVLTLVVLTETERNALTSLRVADTASQQVPFGVASFRARVNATVIDAFVYGRELEGIFRGCQAGWRAFQYYRRKHRITIIPCNHRRRPNIIANMSNETCVKLIPSRLVGSGQIKYQLLRRRDLVIDRPRIDGTVALTEVATNRHTYIEGGDEIFVPTILGNLCEVEAACCPTPGEASA